MATPSELASAGHRTITNACCDGAALDLGATVTQWKPRGQPETLFLSRRAKVSPGDEIHGGIPLCAPWFGQGREDARVPHPHGLVRWMPWRLVEERQEKDATTLVWELTAAETAAIPGHDKYPDDVLYRHEVRFADTLTLSLTVASPTTAFVLDEAFHTYFSISDIEDVVINGLEDTRVRDYTDGATWRRSRGPLEVRGHRDQIHDNKGFGDVTITDAHRVLTLRTNAANTIVWNPGPDGANSLTGWAADEWTSMVCVEVGNVQHNAVTVPAGGSHTLVMEIVSEPLA